MTQRLTDEQEVEMLKALHGRPSHVFGYMRPYDERQRITVRIDRREMEMLIIRESENFLEVDFSPIAWRPVPPTAEEVARIDEFWEWAHAKLDKGETI